MLSDREILELAERARQGDREALEGLAGALRPLVCRWALVITGDPDDAEDVAQRVMMKMVTSIGGFDGRSKVTSWLYRITRNAALDHQRRQRRTDGWPRRRNGWPGRRRPGWRTRSMTSR